MNVKLVPHIGTNVITRKEECFQQYFVFEGHPDKMKLVGLIGWNEGSKLLFTSPIDPISEDKIRAEVSRQMSIEAEYVSCPDIPEELLHPPEESYFDEFNESDFT
jgi:hypothetical protein